MGVPKFYRWISERYPCLSEVISDSQIPEFDNLYLDMNGIIHNCSHPNDDDVTFRITEEEIFKDIFDYIENLFNMIRPRKVFYMAVDGVAPRAKMNQQRARRFMSARTAEEQLVKAKNRGEDIPEEARFDSNCITPGTYFMTRLHNELCAWAERKVNTDPKWQNIRIYLSGHNCPGEGEHKIMDFIRAERAMENYDPNTRHCMYGLDADLIMLGLCSHEPHFSLLREEVRFNSRPVRKGKKDNKANDQKKAKSRCDTFHLLHLSLLREYLAWEFHDIKDKLSFPYDMERIVDDWVLMGFLVGNDFIPHLPHIHIHDDGLPLLYDTYKQVLPSLEGYINESGVLNLKRFEAFLKAVAQNDKNHFLQAIEDEQFMKAKRENNGDPIAPPGMFDALMEIEEEELVQFVDSDMSSCSESETNSDEESSGEAAFVSSEEEDEVDDTQKSSSESESNNLASAAEALAEMNLDDPMEDEFSQQLALSEFMPRSEKDFENNAEACWSRSIGNSFKRYKRAYYRDKLKFSNISKEQLKAQSEGYVRAIQWVLHYYYHGCVSWNWYFEHHYAPYLSDVINFADMEMTFDLSEPFHPFEQLLAVLPAASADCLPVPLRELMCSSESPITDFYPKDFKTDLNGKKNDWEAVVLIPFIDEKRLLDAIHSKESQLTPEENKRNSHGPHVLFTTISGPIPKAKVSLVDKDSFRLAKEKVVWGLLPNVQLDVFFPGFPTMKHLPHYGKLKNVNVNVFQQPSKKASMVLKIQERDELQKDLSSVAVDLIGKEVCVEWPVLKMGVVDSIIGENKKFVSKENGGLEIFALDEDEQAVNAKLLRELKDRYLSQLSQILVTINFGQMNRFAIDVSESKAFALVRRFLGISYEASEGVLIPSKQYAGADTAIAVPIDLIVSNITVEEGKRLNKIPVATAFPSKSKVFVMDPNWAGFGYPALVDKVENSGQPNCRVLVMVAAWKQPDLSTIKNRIREHSLPWYSGMEAGRKAGVRSKLFGRITGTVFLYDGDQETEERGMGNNIKINIGLSLKFTKRNLQVPDYTRKSADNYWQYSDFTVNLIREYKEKFADLFKYLENTESSDDVYYTHDIWKDEAHREKRYEELTDYLRHVPTANIEKQECGMQAADIMVISHLEKAIRETPKQSTFLKSSVNPAKIYRAELFDGKVRPDPEADFQLLDRVVNTIAGNDPPFGLQGTVIGIHQDKLEVLFDKPFSKAYKRIDLGSCARVPMSSVINISYGKERKGKDNVLQQTTPNSGHRMSAGHDRVVGPTSSRKPVNRENKGKRERNAAAPSTSAATKNVSTAKGNFSSKTDDKRGKSFKLAARPVVTSDNPELQKQIVQDHLSALLGIKKDANPLPQSDAVRAKDADLGEAKTDVVVPENESVNSPRSAGVVHEKQAEEKQEETNLDKNMRKAVEHYQKGRVVTNSAANNRQYNKDQRAGASRQLFASQPFQNQSMNSQTNSVKLIPTSNTEKVTVTDMKPRTVTLPRSDRGGKKYSASRPVNANVAAVSTTGQEKNQKTAEQSGSATAKRRERKSRLAMNLPTE